MADYTDNLHLILPGDDDYALVENLTDDFQAIDDFAGDVVKVYDPTTTHSKREYCLYQNHIYKCNAFINTPEAFDPSHWDLVILGDEVRNNNSYISNLQSGLAIVQDGDTATKAITAGQYVCWKSSMRYAKANIAVGETLSSTNLGLVTTDGGSLNRISDHIGKKLKKYEEGYTVSGGLTAGGGYLQIPLPSQMIGKNIWSISVKYGHPGSGYVVSPFIYNDNIFATYVAPNYVPENSADMTFVFLYEDS